MDYETGDVCYAYESEGSTNDKQLYLAIVQRMIDHQFDLSNTVLVTDRGYHSLMNMQKLINLELKFVQGVTRAETLFGGSLISTAFPLTILLLPMAA